MAEVALTRGKVALVDDADVELLNRYKWCAMFIKKQSLFYAATRTGGNFILMHRLLTNAPKGLLVDHANRDTLDNRRNNLRVCTKSQNNANKGVIGKHGVKGVFLTPSHRWGAQITVDGRRRFIGGFNSKDDAARAYDAAAVKHFGEFALTNAKLGLI